jgi:ParB-like chromosome segregation protein Spo0J
MKELQDNLINEISSLELDEKVEAINKLKIALHEISPFNTEPVDCVLWVKNETVMANEYNPNSVAPPEMELLRLSISNDGYTQPIVSMDNSDGTREVIDGFHRNRVGKECEDIQKRVQGYLPVVTIRESQEGLNDRVASTIRHNRARGKHKVDSMSDIVVDLKKRNWSDKKISKELGMDRDEVLRLAQISGLVELFADKEFSMAWEVEDSVDYEITEEEIMRSNDNKAG